MICCTTTTITTTTYFATSGGFSFSHYSVFCSYCDWCSLATIGSIIIVLCLPHRMFHLLKHPCCAFLNLDIVLLLIFIFIAISNLEIIHKNTVWPRPFFGYGSMYCTEMPGKFINSYSRYIYVLAYLPGSIYSLMIFMSLWKIHLQPVNTLSYWYFGCLYPL